METKFNSIQTILEERKSLHFNDPAIKKYWEKLTDQLSQNQQLTLDYFKQCNKEDLLLLSEIFEDISLNLKSQKFIRLLKRLQIKFSDIDLKDSIAIAEKYSKL